MSPSTVQTRSNDRHAVYTEDFCAEVDRLVGPASPLAAALARNEDRRLELLWVYVLMQGPVLKTAEQQFRLRELYDQYKAIRKSNESYIPVGRLPIQCRKWSAGEQHFMVWLLEDRFPSAAAYMHARRLYELHKTTYYNVDPDYRPVGLTPSDERYGW